jgi:tRNA-Thr(GGU) m(6)t(6)A37 methyltransferase TsaA
MEEIRLHPIGIIHSPFTRPNGTPIQPPAGSKVQAAVEIYPQYAAGLTDIEGFSHLILLYYCHLARPYSLTVIPFMDSVHRGVFATRAPSRPNPIGLSVVPLISRQKNILTIGEIDILDGTPLLDIKPYIDDVDSRRTTRRGWLDKKIKRTYSRRDDSRFTAEGKDDE